MFCDFNGLIRCGNVNGASHKDVAVLDFHRACCVGVGKTDGAIRVGLEHGSSGHQELFQIVPAVVHRKSTIDFDRGDLRIHGIRKCAADDFRKHIGKQGVFIQPAVVAAFGNQANAGDAGEQVLVLTRSADRLQILPEHQFSAVRPGDGSAVGERLHGLVAEPCQHKPPVSVHHGQFWAAVRQHQQGIGVIPYLRFKGVIGQFVSHDGTFAVAGSFLNVLVCIDLAVIADFIKCHWLPPPMPNAGGLLPGR